ncbi:putative glycosyl transferase (Group 2 family protein) [Desulfamplus magnetovallimortis]|uniref:Putative glycosyl transferase (Group 2 family protein) n=1 Tax=Desulfamplus magnetovallimortis TaxID=1246637 RepID=A0A1W1HC95_9BACT|nr:glycosyltransferase family 2 protein [Desulfamplus magnetovallimortis]SLM29998.1 putative glycosyl transferase (Group 2 family protein) [Desulfamplus magnetovallimortis]
MISVALVSHNNRKDLERLLPSLLSALKDFKNEILVVDNCSTDGTLSFIKSVCPDAVVTLNRKRRGYGANQNQNIEKARGQFIVLMNPDMVVPEKIFHKLTAFMADHPEAGMATCMICNEDGTCQFLNKREPAVFDLLVRRFLPVRLRGPFRKRLDAYEMRDAGYDRVVDVPFVSGSFMFARTSLIREAGGFDERFFMYFEDVDLCRRVRQKSRAMYCPDVKIIHRWERASHKSIKWTIVFGMSAFKYYYKWGVRLF